MNNLITVLTNIICSGESNTQGANATDPLYRAISTIGPYAMGVVLVLGLIYAIILGVKYSKSESADEQKAIQKAIINGITGFVVVFILIAILYAIRGPLVNWMNS